MPSVIPFELNTRPIDEETAEIAARELNETPERVAEAVPELRRLLHENTDLYYPDDDRFLIAVLRPCHFYPESAIKLVSQFSPSIFIEAIRLELNESLNPTMSVWFSIRIDLLE